MKSVTYIIFFVGLIGFYPLLVQSAIQDELPDDYLPFILHRLNNRLEGESEFLKGFKISMDVSARVLGKELKIETILSLVRNGYVTGNLTYPD